MSDTTPDPPTTSKPAKREKDEGIDIDHTKRYIGSCKWFNVLNGFGFINPDGMDLDVFVHQTEIEMQGFRSLAEGERVSFNIRPNPKGKGGWEAYKVGAEVEGDHLKGSEIRPIGKKKENLVRCFKCGQYGHHMAAKCKKAVPSNKKTCYTCGSTEHLSDKCPHGRIAKRQRMSRSSETEESKKESF